MKRPGSRTAGIVLAVFFSILPGCRESAGPAEGGAGESPAMFRAGPEHSGRYDSPSPVGSPSLLWTFQTEGPVRSSPAVSGGNVFVGSGDGNLYAVDRETGRERWRFETGGPVHGSPAVAGGLVYVTGADRHLYAVDQATGAERWRFPFGEDLPFNWGWDYFPSSPVAVEGTLFVGSGDGNVYAVDAATGAERWRFTTGERVRSSPAVAGGVVYAGGMDGSLYALDAATGELTWRFDSMGAGLNSEEFGFDRRSIQSSPAFGEGIVAFGGRDGLLYAVDTASGEERWRFDHQVSWVVSSPAVSKSKVFAGSSDGHFFQAIDLATGEEAWRFPTSARIFSSGSLAGETVYFGCFDRFLYAVDAGTGEERWRFRTDGGILSSPSVAGGAIYFGSDDGRLYAVEGDAAPGRGGEPLARAVFWQEVEGFQWFREGDKVRDYLREWGYEVLDGQALAGFMEERIEDRKPSVVVFAVDRVPPEIASGPGPETLFRGYLDSGGKVVWLGIPPFGLVIDPESGKAKAIDLERSKEALGVSFDDNGSWEILGARATEAGRQWGLDPWWLGEGGVDPAEVTTVLATDEAGRAVAWVKSFGGSEGTGFVTLLGGGQVPFDLASLRVAAEYRGGGS